MSLNQLAQRYRLSLGDLTNMY